MSRVSHLLENSAASEPPRQAVPPWGLSVELKRPGDRRNIFIPKWVFPQLDKEMQGTTESPFGAWLLMGCSRGLRGQQRVHTVTALQELMRHEGGRKWTNTQGNIWPLT